MAEWLVELLFWIVVFIAFFFGFKKLQKRNEDRRKAQDASPQDQTSEKQSGMGD